jgi:hypothetical protein
MLDDGDDDDDDKEQQIPCCCFHDDYLLLIVMYRESLSEILYRQTRTYLWYRKYLQVPGERNENGGREKFGICACVRVQCLQHPFCL